MLALGCLVPVVLLAAGGAIGALIAGRHGGIWGGIIGFACGCAVLLGLLWALERAKTR
jgi:hypothetical protein